MSVPEGTDPDPSPRTPGRIGRESEATAPMPPGEHLGESVGPYRLLSILGEGGFGIVYLAERREPFVQRVALKVLKPGMDSREVVARFEQERRALAVLDHPHVARIFDAGTTEHGRPYFVMEHVPGESITEYCDRRQLPVRARIELLVPVCEAVHHAHQRGLVHRDLKPSNILVSHPEGEPTGFARVIDFGVARALTPGGAGRTVFTQEGLVLGTPEYMSPEQAQSGDVGPASDVYALGVVLFELLTGGLPRDLTAAKGSDAAELRRLILETPPRRPSKVNPEVRGDVETVLLRALAHEPERRYRSAQALADDLRRVLAGEPIEARRDSLTYIVRTRTRSAARRQPAAAVLGAIALALALGYGVIGPLLFEWTTWGRATERLFIGRPGAAIPSWQTVRAITIPDGVAQARLGELAGLQGVGESPTDLRRVHAALMHRLAKAGPRVVVFDINFGASSPHDAELAGGFEALRGATPPVQVAAWVRVWPIDGSGTLKLAPAVASAPGVRFGGVAADTGGELLYVHMYARRPPAPPSPSLVIQAAAAYLQPDWQPQLSLRGDSDAMDLYYTNGSRRLERSDVIRSVGSRVVSEPDARYGFIPGDVVGLAQVVVPPDGGIRDSIVPYDRVLTMPPEALREFVQGRIVVIGDARASMNDLKVLADGRTVPGCVLVGTAIEQVLRDWAVTRPTVVTSLIGLLLAAGLGTFLGHALGARAGLRMAVLAACMAGLVGVTAALYAVWAVYTSPIVATFAMVTACECIVWLRRGF